jgi:hypothetical protein
MFFRSRSPNFFIRTSLGKRYLILEQLDLLKGVEGVSLALRVAIDHELAH